MFVWRQMMQEFKQKWSQIKKRRRVEIHINSLSIDELKRMSMEKFLQRQEELEAKIATLEASLDRTNAGRQLAQRHHSLLVRGARLRLRAA